MAHVRAVCESTSLAVVLYSRANAKYTPETLVILTDTCPNLIGFEDGVGDLESISTARPARLRDAVPKRNRADFMP
ncbi:hypothetical protein GCM10011588_37730 [Nocardia jinanensis]|uniref:Uncharacterized protein n=2 Tax=Nocardia jinanensis TaxID=382504 RepID=A0A917VUN1_9NOCA|nr:hypothetical protein GCM10011588_37730 [Nocardia jinanensis]